MCSRRSWCLSACPPLAFDIRQFALLNEVLVVIWLAVVWGIYREHKRRVAPAEAARQEAA